MPLKVSKPIVMLTLPLLFCGCTQSHDLAPVVMDDQRFNGYYWDNAGQSQNSADSYQSPPVIEQTVTGSNLVKIENYQQNIRLFNPQSEDEAGLKKNRSKTVVKSPVDSRENKSIHSSNKEIKPEKKTLSKRFKPDYNLNKAKKKSIISIDNKNMLTLSFQWPIKGKIQNNFSQTDEKGIDIIGAIGQTVKASEAGKVVYSGQGLIGFGNLLIIKHNDVYLSAYANNSSLFVKEGQRVKKGQDIAEIGVSISKKALLHFEIRKNGKSVNPLSLLPKK